MHAEGRVSSRVGTAVYCKCERRFTPRGKGCRRHFPSRHDKKRVRKACFMRPDDLLNAVSKRPFEPFRVQVSDGTVYDIRHPELVMVGFGAVIIGVRGWAGQAGLRTSRNHLLEARRQLLPLAASADGFCKPKC